MINYCQNCQKLIQNCQTLLELLKIVEIVKENTINLLEIVKIVKHHQNCTKKMSTVFQIVIIVKFVSKTQNYERLSRLS